MVFAYPFGQRILSYLEPAINYRRTYEIFRHLGIPIRYGTSIIGQCIVIDIPAGIFTPKIMILSADIICYEK